MIEIRAFEPEHAAAAAALFTPSLAVLRRNVPELSPQLPEAEVAARLAGMTGFAAVEGRRLVGYLVSWFPIERFRGAARSGAYAPEWAHGVGGGDTARIYRRLYRAAAAQWATAGCDVHAITLLAGDAAALEAWFWSGFGLAVVDAVRPMQPIAVPEPAGFSVRAATLADAPALAALDIEHNRHYSTAPVFMAPRAAGDAAAWELFLAQPGNTTWLSEDGSGPFGFIKFDANDFDGADVARLDSGVFISGAFVLPARRGRGAAAAILNAALRHYAGAGLACCALDFEAFNPEAASFWMRYFTPVCYSLMRVPEWRG